jgi:hypothetical protein
MYPFQEDVWPSALEPVEGLSVESLHEEALRRLDMAGSRGGVVLLTAPKAGFGKTHLLARLVERWHGRMTVLPVRLQFGESANLTRLSQASIEALRERQVARAGWSALREVSGEVVAALMHGLISEGRLACANQDQALRVLAGPVVEIFDAAGSARLIGGWVRQNREQLRAPLAALASERVSPERPLSPLWVEALLEQAVAGGAAGVASMHELAATESAGDGTAWLRLLKVVRPVAVIFDHLDALHQDAQAGIKVAALAVELAEVHHLRAVLSVNQDLWQSSFGSHLPSALEDRLSAQALSLRGLSQRDAEALVQLRLAQARVAGGEAAEFLRFLAVDRFFLGRPVGSVAARAFLRHAARQWEIFRHSVPPPAGEFEDAPVRVESVVPLMPDLSGQEAAVEVPAIFDEETTAYVKDMAQGFSGNPPAAVPPSSEARPAPAPEPKEPIAPSPDAFEKLREMLGKLRQPAVTEAAAEESAERAGAAVAVMEPPAAPEPQMAAESDALKSRFDALRVQLGDEAESQPLDFTKVGDLIRLAGRRFPLVRFSEHELAGTSGRQVMVWSLQGVEIVFGMANFSDTSYWRSVGAFVAARQVEVGTQPVKVKLVTFRSDREQSAYQAMMSGNAVPEAVAASVDPVHLDSGSMASLYAMHRIIKEAEAGVIQARPAQVMSALARELDFFWRRVTRLG